MLQVFRDEGNLPRPFQIKCQGCFKAKGSPGFFCSTSFFLEYVHEDTECCCFFLFLLCYIALMHSNTHVSPPPSLTIEMEQEMKTKQEIIPQFLLSLDALKDIIFFFFYF